jgi:hypothetical protein
MRGHGKSQALNQARHVVMFLCQRELGMSSWEIIQQLCRKDITSVRCAMDGVRAKVDAGDALTMSAVAVGAMAGQQARTDMLRKVREDWVSDLGKAAE